MQKVLKMFKMMSSKTQPMAFTFPDGMIVTPLSPYSFLASTVLLTLMALGNDLFRDLVNF